MNKKNLPLLIGLALPIVFIVVISLVIYIPSFLVRPAHNFLYTTEDASNSYGTYYEHEYKVSDRHLVTEAVSHQSDMDTKMPHKDVPTLYLYDVHTNTSHEISPDVASTYTLDPGPASSDGYTVTYQYTSGGFFLFESRGQSGYVISNGKGSKKLTGFSGQRYYGSQDMNFIGWVE
jgi:hypothetical protein